MLTKCPICGYLLDGLPERHSCPECGFDYDKSMTPFDGLRKRYFISGYLRLLLLATMLPGLAILIQIDPNNLLPIIIPAVVLVPSLAKTMIDWIYPARHAKLIFLGEHELVIVPICGEPKRFDWNQLGRAEKSRIDGAVRIIDIEDHIVASLSRRSFTTDWFAGRLVELINGNIEAARTDE